MSRAHLSAACLVLGGCLAANAAGAAAPTTLSYVLQSYDYLFYKQKEPKQQCPKGFALTNEEQWEAQFPTEVQRRSHLSRCLLQANRGPNCENVWSSPETVKDPLPFRAVESAQSFGANLDGNEDGKETANTCAHQQFVSPEGQPGIDNQYYRFLACDKFIQSAVYAPMTARDRTAEYLFNRLLLEVKGVDSEVNDEAVEVVLYRGKDPLLLDANGDALPWQTQRVDETLPAIQLRGRIEDGTLITEPADVFFEGLFHERRQLIRGMSLRLKMNGVHAEGMRVGYVDVERLWQSYAHAAKWGGNTYGVSPPSAYQAMHELADGYKDPQTGECTALSSARGYKFVRAHLVRGAGEGES